MLKRLAQFTTLLLYLQEAAPDNRRLLLAGALGAMRGGVMVLIGIPGGALFTIELPLSPEVGHGP